MYIIPDTQLPVTFNITASQYLGQEATHKMDQEVNCTFIKPARQRICPSFGSNHKASTSLQTGGPSSSGPQSPLSEDASRDGVQHQSCHPLPPIMKKKKIIEKGFS